VPQAADDAKNLRCVMVADLPSDLVFDHALILQDYRHYLETGECTPLRSG
jgi:8-oxo-dGTP diphosphatase